jgi:hypothetical protein
LSTLLRWIGKGARAHSGEVVRLEAIRLGSRWHTSQEALQRFAAALTPQPTDQASSRLRTLGERRRATERAAARLESLGL